MSLFFLSFFSFFSYVLVSLFFFQIVAGSYCLGDGTARSCPGGTFGSSEGLSTANCSGLCLGGYYCPPGSISPTEYPCTHMQPSDKHASYYCPEGSHVPIPTRLGFYVTYQDDPQRYGHSPSSILSNNGEGGGYFGDVATIAISFNVTTSAQPTTDRRALLKANIANNLLKIDEKFMGRFGVFPLNRAEEKDSYGWAVRFEATHSVSAVGYETASRWKDGVKASLVSKPYVLNDQSSSLVNIAVDTDSVRGVVAGRRTMVIMMYFALYIVAFFSL